MTDPASSRPGKPNRPDTSRPHEIEPTVELTDPHRAETELPLDCTIESQNAGTPGAVSKSTGVPMPGETADQAGPLAVVGHFELYQQIGQGGMGTVYRAFDTRLRRDVAVKILTAIEDKSVSSQGKQRFIKEAQITGQLQHPGIPPVHELGTLEDGRPFLAMKLVKGRTLHELLRRRSSPAEELSRYIAIFEQICHAIGYAHSHRVLHRDLKPSNVMVGAHGEVQVMDWGLAKVLTEQPQEEPHPQDDADEVLPTLSLATKIDTADQADSATRTGQVLGTPAYMAPEQAAGEIDKLDQRSDVFGLGAILCEILTGKPPYSGKNVHEVLLKAVRGELDEAYKRLDACAEEPELVALCRRCLAFDQADRPPDGNAVAAEVTRIREAAEARARRAELEKAEALVREAEQRKRRRQVLLAAAVVVVVLAIGAVGTTLGMWQAQRSRREAEQARQIALRKQQEALAERDAKAQALAQLEVALKAEQEAKALEQEARTQAMAALRFMTDDAIKHLLAEGKSHLSRKKREYLKRVVEFYEGFARIRGQGAQALAIRAEGLYRVGKLQFYLGELDAARQNLQRAADIYRRLVQVHPDEPEPRRELAQVLNWLSWVLMRAASDYETAARVTREAIAIGRALVERFPETPEYQNVLATSHTYLAYVYQQISQYSEAEKEFAKAIVIQKKLVEQFPEMREYQNLLARSYSSIATVYKATNRYAEAEEAYKKAIAIQTKLAHRFPDIPEYQSALAAWYNNLALLYKATGNDAKAEEEFTKALSIQKGLAQHFSEVPEYQRALATTWNNLAILYRKTSRYTEAEAAYKKAIALQEKLVQQFPEVAEYQGVLATNHNNLAFLYKKTGRYAEAEEEHVKAIAIRKKLAEQFPEVPEYRNALAASYNNLAVLYKVTGRYTEAEEAYKKAIAIQQQLVQQFPEVVKYQGVLATTWNNLAFLYKRTGRYVEAEEAYNKAIAIRKKLAEQFPKLEAYQTALARNYRNLATFYRTTNRHSEAVEQYKKEIAVHKNLTVQFPGVARHRSSLAKRFYFLGAFYDYIGRYEEAAEQYRQAAELREQLVKQFPESTQHRSDLSLCYHSLGRVKQKTRQYDEAEKFLKKAIELREQLVQESPGAAEFIAELARSRRRLGDVYKHTKRYDKAQVEYKKALHLAEKLLREFPATDSDRKWLAIQWPRERLVRVLVWNRRYNEAKALSDAALADCQRKLKVMPESKTYQRGLAMHLVPRTLLLAALGRQSEALATAERLAALKYDPKEAAAWAAKGLSLAVRGVAENESLDEAVRRQSAETFAQRAIAMLRLAIQRGYRNVEELRTDPDFDPIRKRKDFQEIVKQLSGTASNRTGP